MSRNKNRNENRHIKQLEHTWTAEERDTFCRTWRNKTLSAHTVAVRMGLRNGNAASIIAARMGLPTRRELRNGSPEDKPGIRKDTVDRNCMTCGEPFLSEGFHNRMCFDCRAGPSEVHYV